MATAVFTVASAVAILVLLVLSAFFSSSEIAIFTLPRDWVDSQDPASDRRLATLGDLQSDPHRLLVTILVGNNIVNVAIASITTVALIEYLPTGHAVTVATVLASFVVLIFGEILPKSYGLGRAEQWALTVARPITVVQRALYPVVAVFDFVTRSMNAAIGGEPDIEKPYLDD